MRTNLLLALSLFATLLSAQTAPPVSKPLGLESAWTLRGILDDLLKDNEKLEPLLAQMNYSRPMTCQELNYFGTFARK